MTQRKINAFLLSLQKLSYTDSSRDALGNTSSLKKLLLLMTEAGMLLCCPWELLPAAVHSTATMGPTMLLMEKMTGAIS